MFDIANYDLADIGVAAVVGNFAPGMLGGLKGAWPAWVPFVGKSRGAGGAIQDLWGQLDRAKTANRIAKIEQRIQNHGSEVAKNLVYNSSYQGVRQEYKSIANSDAANCSCAR
jgi:hypothetical protein